MNVAAAVGLDPGQLLETLLRNPSPTGSVSAAARALAALARDAGFATSTGFAGSLVMSWGDDGPPIDSALVLLGHLDTVAGGPRVRREDGRLHGRGSVDAKGPLAAALAAVSRLPRRERGITVVAAIDEEGASECARALSRAAPPSHLIVLEPSGWDTITVAYRGCVRVRLHLEQDVAHHALPRPSAADSLIAALSKLRRNLAELDAAGACPAGRAVDRLQLRVNTLACETDAGVEHAVAGVEVRLPAAVAVDAALERITGATAGMNLEIDSACPAVAVSRANPVCRALARAVAASGGQPSYTTKTGTSDLNVVLPAWRCPAAVYGPGDPSLDHTPHESVEIEDLHRSSRVLEAALAALR